MSRAVVDEVDVEPRRARVYAEGWQSWSPTGWAPRGAVDRPELPWQHTMRFRPGSALPGDTDTVQAEGLLVLDPGTGAPCRAYSLTSAAEAVPTIRAAWADSRLVVSSDGPVTVSTHPGPVAALTAFGDRFAADAGVGSLRPAPRVWCTWYRYFEEVTADDVLVNLAELDRAGLEVDVVQIDDGWSTGLGDGLRPSRGVPDLERLVDSIRAGGRRTGIWLAPFLVGADTELARRHPDWLLGDAGVNWHQDLRALDLTHPGVRDLLVEQVSRLRDLGIDYFKLDFLYAGAVPGRRHDDVTGVAAYRSGLALLREAAGPDAYLLGCGAPVLPSVGLVDAMRVSPDTFHEGGEDGSTGLRGARPLVARSWQQGRLWVNDPDCLVTRPSYRLREEWAEVCAAHGGLRSFSDRVGELDSWGLETTRRLLAEPPPPTPFPDDVLAAALEPEEAR